MKYVNADELLLKCTTCALVSDDGKVHGYFTGVKKSTIENFPASDVVEVRHGHVVEVNANGCLGWSTWWKCSECSAFITIYPKYPKYCSECGAILDGEMTRLYR